MRIYGVLPAQGLAAYNRDIAATIAIQRQRPKRPWTDEETMTARRLLKQRAPKDEFVRVLGRDRQSAQNRIAWLDRADNRYISRPKRNR